MYIIMGQVIKFSFLQILNSFLKEYMYIHIYMYMYEYVVTEVTN